MIDVAEKLIFEVPTNDGGVTKPYNKSTHIGVDFGWYNTQNTIITAIQDGVVVDNFYSASCGNALVLQHNYADGTHRWSGYIHLQNRSTLAKGATVSRGCSIGARKGNTGNSTGTHLHIYVSDCTTSAYN